MQQSQISLTFGSVQAAQRCMKRPVKASRWPAANTRGAAMPDTRTCVIHMPHHCGWGRTFGFRYPPTSCDSDVFVQVSWVYHNSLQKAGQPSDKCVMTRQKFLWGAADIADKTRVTSGCSSPDRTSARLLASFPACLSFWMARHQQHDRYCTRSG